MTAQFPVKEFVCLDANDINRLVEEHFGTGYSMLDSIEELHNDSYELYSIQDDYEDIVHEADLWAEDIELWKAAYSPTSSCNFVPPWQWLLTLLIRDGHAPKNDYLIDTAW